MRFFPIFGLLFLSLFLLMACSEEEPKAGSHFLLPWPDQNGNYDLKEVNISTLKDIKKAKGDAADIYIHPQFINGQLGGEPPNLRVAKADGLYIPKDVESEEALTVYAHMERLMAIDEKLGLKNQISWPRRVGIQVLAKDPRRPGRKKNNASYNHILDGLMYFPYSLNGIPLSYNAGVIAHEHFHSLFYPMVQKPLEKKGHKIFFNISRADLSDEKIKKDPVKQKKNAFYIRVINEALADLWAIAYIQDLDFVNKSLNSENRDYNSKSLIEPINEPHIGLHTDFEEVDSIVYWISSSLVSYALERGENKFGVSMNPSTYEKERMLDFRFVMELSHKIRDVLIKKWDKGLSAEDMVAALHLNTKLSDKDCNRLKGILKKENPLYQKCGDPEDTRHFRLDDYVKEKKED